MPKTIKPTMKNIKKDNREINLVDMETVMKIYPEIDRSNVNYNFELDKLFMKFLKKLIITRSK